MSHGCADKIMSETPDSVSGATPQQSHGRTMLMEHKVGGAVTIRTHPEYVEYLHLPSFLKVPFQTAKKSSISLHPDTLLPV
jgi:hypothetical protein